MFPGGAGVVILLRFGRGQVREPRRSGWTAASFARRYGIKVKRLRRWARELEEEVPKEGALRFHPVRVVEGRGESPRRGRPIEIVTRRGARVRVRVPAGFRAEDLERVLVVLGEGEGC